MKKLLITVFIILMYGSFNLIYSQNLTSTTKSKPLVEISISGAYNYSLFDLNGSGSLKDFWSFQDYGMGSGFGTMVDVKLGVYSSRMFKLKVYSIFGYSHFATSEEKAYNVRCVDGGWPYKTSSNTAFVPRDTAGNSSLRLNMPYIGFGLECALYTDRDTKSSFNFGADFNLHLITGRAFENIINMKESYVTINPSARFGVGINIEYAYRFEDWVGFHVGTRYTMPNLFSKSSEMTDQSGYISLLDDSNTALNPLMGTKRVMGYMQLFGGVTFYMGKL
jgi:hypothetical protein